MPLELVPDRVFVLSCEAEIAASYTHHVPVLGQFILAAPYQSKGEGPLHQSRAGQSSELKADTLETQHAGQRSTTRKRKRAYAPNPRELRAERRHAAFQNSLASAAETVAKWFGGQSQDANDITAALHRTEDRVSTDRSTNPAVFCPSISPQNGTDQLRYNATACAETMGSRNVQEASARRTYAVQPQPSASNNKKEGAGKSTRMPDCIGWASTKAETKPKLYFLTACQAFCEDSAASGTLSAVQRSASAASNEENVEALPARTAAAVNLFGKLIRNSSHADAIATAMGCSVVLPPRSAFLMSDIRQMQPLVQVATRAGGWHLIVADPPWENASANRSASYPLLPSRNLLGVPMRRLLHPAGLLALWMTNRERHWKFVEEELLPMWGLQTVATWLWLKVTDTGNPVAPLDVVFRRPYEAVLLCKPCQTVPQTRQTEPKTSAQQQPDEAATSVTLADTTAEDNCAAAAACDRQSTAPGQAGPSIEAPPQQLVFAAVAGCHSRKPHLGRLLQKYCPFKPRSLELFARELAADWTSWGNEPLHFQSAVHLRSAP